MTHRTYFDTQSTAWAFAKMLPKTRFTVTGYGIDESRKTEQYYIEYIDKPAYAR